MKVPVLLETAMIVAVSLEYPVSLRSGEEAHRKFIEEMGSDMAREKVEATSINGVDHTCAYVCRKTCAQTCTHKYSHLPNSVQIGAQYSCCFCVFSARNVVVTLHLCFCCVSIPLTEVWLKTFTIFPQSRREGDALETSWIYVRDVLEAC